MTISINDQAIQVNGQTVASVGSHGIATNPQTISVTMAANAVTIAALNSVPLTFRSATATDGSTSIVRTPSANLVIPDTATLGSTNAVAATYIVVEMNNGGTREFAVSNMAGGLQCDEQNLISTTAISTAADSANVWYSTTARSNLPYQVVGTFTCTQATAGTWATSASAVQSAFGNALTAMSSIGYGQTWQDVTGSRSSGTVYYNTTGKPIQCFARGITATTALGTVQITVDGVTAAYSGISNANGNQYPSCSAIVPIGSAYTYTFAGNATKSLISELR